MEVGRSEWRNQATTNVTQYLHRGGQGRGDEPQLIGGCDLLNTIGWAMGLPTTNPERWTERQLRAALEGQLVFYEGDALAAIDAVAAQISECCGGDRLNYVTVLPVELYFDRKLYELPLFRVKRTTKSRNFYIDNVGRCYDSLADWDGNNKLPPGEVGYPAGLSLSLRIGTDRAKVTFAQTPPARPAAQVARGADVASAAAGLGASVALLFVSGGLAAPLVATSLGAAAWGTARAACQLGDRASHGESVNPFTDAESRMLWLGVAASLASFGGMGATMRLSSLAARGRACSNAMRVLANVANGTSATFGTLAVVNSTIYMIEHHEDMQATDILMQTASIAFWSMGVFRYRTASMIIRDAQNYAFASITSEMSPDEMRRFEAVRNRIGNDANLLQRFHAAMSANIPARAYSQLLTDGMHYFDTVATLSAEQIGAFDDLRVYLRDDVNLISGLRRLSASHNLNPTETVERVLQMWQHMRAAPAADGGGVALRGGSLILGSAPPIRIDQLPQLSAQMIRFVGEHMSRLDAATGRQWATALPALLELQRHGMFTACAVTRVVSAGRAVVSLNGQLDVSIHRLLAMSAADRSSVFRLLGRLPPGAPSAALPAELVRLCVREQRLRLECHRRESEQAARRLARGRPALLELLGRELQSHERDRLYTFLRDVEVYRADAYAERMMAFVADMRPASVSEMVAYSEFVMTYVEDQALALKVQIRNGELPKPEGVKVSVWTRNTAMETVFRDTAPMRERFAELLAIVRDNRMVGSLSVGAGLSDAQLEAAVRRGRLAYGAEVSAAYHVAKHPTRPPAAHVERANATLRGEGARVATTLGQAGDVRLLAVEDEHGRCFVLERDGRVILCSFIPR